jgi:DNA-binding CsgD family transcriptional regulator
VLESEDFDELGPNGSLSHREREVLEMTALGLTNGQIAERLGVTVHAIKFHLASIYRKLGVANRTEAAVLYLRGERGDSPAVSEPGGTR